MNVQELFLPYLTIEASLFIGVATSDWFINIANLPFSNLGVKDILYDWQDKAYILIYIFI